jgi:hypothetical protein
VCSPPAQNKLELVHFPSSLIIPAAGLRRDFRLFPRYYLFVPVVYEGAKSIKIVALSAGEVKLEERERSVKIYREV